VQTKAQRAYSLWAKNPAHPSLRFKKVHRSLPIYAVRIDLAMVWFWIGPHAEYEKLLAKL